MQKLGRVPLRVTGLYALRTEPAQIPLRGKRSFGPNG
jgi:hypothetical protein